MPVDNSRVPWHRKVQKPVEMSKAPRQATTTVDIGGRITAPIRRNCDSAFDTLDKQSPVQPADKRRDAADWWRERRKMRYSCEMQPARWRQVEPWGVSRS